MGNFRSLESRYYKDSRNNIQYEKFINDNNLDNQDINNNYITIRRLETQLSVISDEITSLKQKHDRTEQRMRSQDLLIQNKLQEFNQLIVNLQFRVNLNEEKITIITKDMESLLNNDKLLLDKLIEKNIVSTIQEHEYKHEHKHEQKQEQVNISDSMHNYYNDNNDNSDHDHDYGNHDDQDDQFHST